MKARFVRLFYKLHKWVGLFVALHFILLSLTGSLLLFREEITGESHEHGPTPAIAAQKILEQTQLKAPTSRPLSLIFKDDSVVEMRLGLDDSGLYRQSHRLYYQPDSSEAVYTPQKPDWFDFILRFHREFLLGSNGKIYVGLIGILYTFTLLSGFLIYGPFHKKLGFGEIRRKSPKSTWSDLHKYLGIVCLSWGVIIGVTGAFLGLSSTLIKLFQYQELQYLTEKYPTTPDAPWASLDQVLESAQKAVPESTFEFLAFPNTQFSPPGHFLVLFHGNTPLTEKLVDLVVVDALSGEVTDVRPLPWYLKVTLLSEPLHFGNYGGLSLKLMWLVLSLASLFLPVLGILISLKKNQVSSAQKNTQLVPSLLLSETQIKKYKPEYFVIVATPLGILGCFFLQGVLAWTTALLILPAVFFAFLALRIFKKEAP